MTQLPNRALPWPIAWQAVALIAEREGCRLRAYRNFAAEPWTCGFGETEGVGANTVWTQEFADQRFCDSLTERADAVRAACSVEPNENELGALVSLAYNIGLGWAGSTRPKGAKDGLRQSTVLRQHNLGNRESAARAFGLWNKADGKISNGLVARRAAEAALYLTPPAGTPPAPMPQTVDAESKPIAGPIAGSAATVAGGGLLGLLDAFKEHLGSAKGAIETVKGVAVDTLGIPADWLLPLVLVILGGIILRWRYKQRSTGNA